LYGAYAGYDVPQLEALYDEQRGMNLQALQGAGETVSAALDSVSNEKSAQSGAVARLPQIWSGGAASEIAHRMMSDQVRLAGEDIQAARAVANTIGAAVGAARQAVIDKAVAARALVRFDGDDPEPVIAGRTPDDARSPADVELMVAVAGAGEWISSDQIRSLAGMFPSRNLMRSSGDLDPGGRNPVSRGVGKDAQIDMKYWLDTVFKPDIEGNLTLFADACRVTRNTIDGLYGTIIDAMKQVHSTAYPRPSAPVLPTITSTPDTTTHQAPSAIVPSSAQTPAVPAPAVPAPVVPVQPAAVPAAPVEPVAAPSTTMPSTTMPSALMQLAAVPLVPLAAVPLVPLAAVPLVPNAVTDPQDDAAAPQPPRSGQLDQGNADGPRADFDLGGRHLIIESGPAGGIELVTPDQNGKDRTYSLQLDDHGLPIITLDDHQGSPGEQGSAHNPPGVRHSSDHQPSDDHSSTQHPGDQQPGERPPLGNHQPGDHQPDRPLPARLFGGEAAPGDHHSPHTQPPTEAATPSHPQAPTSAPTLHAPGAPSAAPRPTGATFAEAGSLAELAEAGPL
jgi:hypothetical protein